MNLSREACDARNAFKTAVKWCFETVGNISEHEMARELKDDAFDHMMKVCGDPNLWTLEHELCFRDDIRTALRRVGRY